MVVPTHWDFLMGGAQLQAKFLLEELTSRENVEVSYLASRVSGDTPKNESYTLTQVSAPGALHRYGLFWDYFSLLKRLKEYQPDVIYQRVATAYTGICARYAKRHSVPMIWHVANSTDCDINKIGVASLRRPHSYLERAFVEYGLKNATDIVVQTEDQKRLLSENFGKQNTHLIPNFHPIPKPEKKPDANPFRILWIANLKDTKRPQAMVEVARQLSHLPGLSITMIGAPYPNKEQAKQNSFDTSVAGLKNLNYAGALPLEKVNELLEQSHLLVNTSVKEGFSNTFIQAWLRKVPVLTLGVNPDDRLDGGPLGQSFSSIEALVDGITAKLANPEQLERDGVAARQIAVAEFSLDNVSKLADLVLSYLQCDPPAA